MAKQKTPRLATAATVKSTVKKEFSNTFFLIHGYTGSPTDFNGLPNFLTQTFGATVEVPLLIGHGTRIEDLDGLTFQDFLNSVEPKLKARIDAGERVVLIGHSYGGFLALHLASRYPVAGVFTTATPYQLKFPFNIPAMSLLGYIRKYWPKKLPLEEIQRREAAFYYGAMPAYGLTLAHDARRIIQKTLSNVTCPLLTIQSRHEHISDERSPESMHTAAGSKVKEVFILDNETHGVFYSGHEETIYQKISEFVERHQLFA